MTNLQKYRRQALLSQVQLSLMVGAHRDYINRLESQKLKAGKSYANAIVRVINAKFVELHLPIEITIEELNADV